MTRLLLSWLEPSGQPEGVLGRLDSKALSIADRYVPFIFHTKMRLALNLLPQRISEPIKPPFQFERR